MRIDYMFTRGDQLRARGPHGINEVKKNNGCIIEGSMFTRGDELRTRGPHGRKMKPPRIRGSYSKETMAARGSGDMLRTRGPYD